MLEPNAAERDRAENRPNARKRRGNLAKTLDRALQPRLPPGRPGRPKGSRNYQWTPEMDRILEELCTKFNPAKAKGMMKRQLLQARAGPGSPKPRPDSLRNAVERRMAHLRLPTGRPRKTPAVRTGRPWTETETTALLGAVGSDLEDKSIEQRTHHTIRAARAKLTRLDYSARELRGEAFTVDELAAALCVTARQVRRWKERGWLNTTRRRISQQDLAAFLRAHHEVVPYRMLPRDTQLFLIDLGYPASDAAQFRATVKAILETVGGRKRRSDARIAGAVSSR